MMNKLNFVLFSICVLLISKPESVKSHETILGWKAGVSRILITPKESMWMAGDDHHDHSAVDKLQDLWAKALILRDASGKQCALITLDLYGLPKSVSDNIRAQLKLVHKLDKSRVIINCSNNHSGPLVSGFMKNFYDPDYEKTQKIKSYTELLSGRIIQLVGEALKSMEPADIYTENGFARFQVNKRTNNEKFLVLQPELNGPNDYAVPVLKITGKSDKIIAIAFGYASRNNVLNDYQWAGDYAGYAQLELEKLYPGSVALFFQGAGADLQPSPRGNKALAKQYGKELAYAVEAVLSKSMKPQPSNLSFGYAEVKLPLNTPPSKEQLAVMAKDTTAAYKQRSASHLLRQIEKGESPAHSYPYPIQAWKIGNQSLFALGGEPVIDYALAIKNIFGSDAFVLGYSNDVMGYIVTPGILKESNDKESDYAFYDPTDHESTAYEGGLFTQLAYGLPSTWASNIESVILNEVARIAHSAGIEPAEYK